MSELNIKIRKVQDNGSVFKANPDTLYLGGMRSAKVDRLRFEVPEEWKNCTISLHVRRLSGTLPDPQLLDENYSVLVDRRWTLEAQGYWMLLAMDENGYIAMSKPGQYTCYETIDTDSTTETLTPSIYEQFVAQVTGWANQAKDSMNAAAESAKKAESEADRAEQAVADLDQTREDSIQAVQKAQRTATDAVAKEKTDAVKAVGDKLTESLGKLDTAKGAALDEVADATQEAKNAAAESKASAEKSASEAAKAESSAGAAKTSEEAAKESENHSKEAEAAAKKYLEQVKTIAMGAQGWYETAEALKTEIPVGENGWWAIVGDTDTIWTWDNDDSAWKNTATVLWENVQGKPDAMPANGGTADNSTKWGGKTLRLNHNTNDTWIPVFSDDQVDYVLKNEIVPDRATNAEYIGNDNAYMRFHWNGQGGQPTWLFGSNDGANSYVWNPSNFNVNYANGSGNVQGFWVTAQTGDPGAWSNLDTNRVLLVYE